MPQDKCTDCKMQGTISITRYSTNTLLLCVDDETSRTQFLRLELTPEALALALTGLAAQPCTFELRAQHVGKRRETKEERVWYHAQYRRGSEEERTEKHEALMPFETEGWRGNPNDLGNHHRGDKNKGYVTTFVRFVENITDKETF